MISVPPKSLATAIDHLNRGGRLCVATRTRTTIIELKHVNQWAKAGRPLIREEGDGYRLAQGKSSVYLIPGQLTMID